MYVGLLLLLCIQCCGACRSTADCQVLPVAPILTPEQADTLYQLYLKLKPLSCDELMETIYNITEAPIHLTAEQSRELANYYPAYFKKPVNPKESPIKLNCSKRSRRDVTPSVCNTLSKYQTYHVAVDTYGNPVYIPQLNITGENLQLVQQFEEYDCLDSKCSSGVKCTCKKTLPHVDNAILTYMNNLSGQFQEGNINLLDCAAYIK